MRVALLTIGLLMLVLLVMPHATAKFTGQHTFLNGTQVAQNCGSCHKDVDSEYNSDTTMPHRSLNYGCDDCHIGNPTKWKTLANDPLFGDPAFSGVIYHGAALVECLWCHGNTTANTGTVVEFEFENSTSVEAHRPLYWRATNASGVDTNDMLRGANEACIACHTHAANVTIVEPTQYLNITANYTDCTSPPNCYDGWNINFSVG